MPGLRWQRLGQARQPLRHLRRERDGAAVSRAERRQEKADDRGARDARDEATIRQLQRIAAEELKRKDEK